MGKLIIKRLPGISGTVCKMICYIDDDEICRLRENEQFIYKTEKELCTFKCKLTLGNPLSDKYEIDFENGEVVYINATSGILKPKVKVNYRSEKSHKAVDEIKEIKQEGNETAISETDEILKYKNLLDKGIITKEEFEKKKKKILGNEKKTLQSLKCPNCGATYNPDKTYCEYCHSYLIMNDGK